MTDTTDMRSAALEELENFCRRTEEIGAEAACLIDPHSVETAEWVRWKCRYGCGGYGTSLVCPPQTPTPAETRRMLDEFSTAILFTCGRGQAKRIAATIERELFLAGHYKAFGLGSGPCRLCDICAMEEGCNHPAQARPSMEACGIDVYASVRKHGFEIDVVTDYDEPQNYFGLILIS